MPTYAADTQVSVEKSRNEIERTLTRYKADAFAYASEVDPPRVSIMFRMGARQIRFILAMPDPRSRAFTHHARGQRTPSSALALYEQACRQKWRALALVIKAKLEAVDAGISTFENEFLAATVLANGRTVGETINPQIDEHYRLGGPPNLMLTHEPS